MPNLLTSLFRRSPAEISRVSLSDYVRQRVAAIEGGFAFSTYETRGKVEKAEDTYASLASYAYRGDSVVAACMRVRRDLFRQAKFCWREVDDAGPGKVFRTDELSLLDKPWPNGTTGELLARMITDVDLCGNSFILNEGERLRWLRPDWVEIILSGDPQEDADVDVLGYVYTPGGTGSAGQKSHGVPYKPDEICHWSPEQDPLAFYRGMSWVSKALEDIRGDRAATTHKLAFFSNGATLGPIVRAPAGMTVQQFKEFVAAAEEAHAGAANAYKTMYLGGGAEVTLAAADFRQLDLKAVQGGYETRIAAVAGVHPVLVGLSEGLAGSSLNSGNFAAARRATAEMTLYALWQDACGALQAFFDVPKDAELWIRERDIPFLREEAKDRAEIFKTQILAIEAAMRAGFKPDPTVKATLEERLDLLVGAHTGLFSVQMQAPQTGMPGAEPGGPGAPAGPGAPPPPPTDFGALRADLWDVDEDDIERAVADLFDDLDEIERFDPDQARIPGGHSGGGRWGSLITELLTSWAKGDGPDDPLGAHGFKRDQLQKKITTLRKQAAAVGDHERVARLTPPRAKPGESDAVVEDRLKAILYEDVGAHVRAGRDAEKPSAKFTLQGKVDPAKVREVEVENRIRAAYRDARAAGTDDDPSGPFGTSGNYVMLTKLRAHLKDLPRHEVDEALRRMARGRDDGPSAASLAPYEAGHLRTGADEAASVRMGSFPQHMVEIPDPSPRPLPKDRRDLDVAVYRDKDGKPALFEESDSGKRGPLVERFDSLDEMQKWAEANGEPRLVEWARKEGGAGAPKAPAPVKKAAPRKAAPGQPATPKPVKGRNLTQDRAAIDSAHEAGKSEGEWRPSGAGIGSQRGGRVDTAAGGYQAHLDLAKAQGFDGRPRVITNDEVDRLEKAGWRPLYRGWGWGTESGRGDKTGADMADEYLYGPLHVGGGIGLGTNMSDDYDAAAHYAMHDRFTHIPGGKTVGFMLSPDARVIRYPDAVKRRDAYLAKLPAGPEHDAERAVFDDPGTFAMALGFDALVADDSEAGIVKKGTEEWVIFNRTAVAGIDDNKHGAADFARKQSGAKGIDRLREVAKDGYTYANSGDGARSAEQGARKAAELDALVEQGYLRKDGISYRITDAGREYLAGDVPASPSPAAPKSTPEPTSLDSLRNLNDAEAIRDELDLRKVDELKPLLREAGLPVSGRKRDLVDRLTGHLSGGGGTAPAKAAPSAAKAGDRAPATPTPVHDLFEADDATVEAALKDVFEGQFGPYTTKATVKVTRAGTRVDKRGREHKVEPAISIEGKIYDEQGHEIGYFGQDISSSTMHYGYQDAEHPGVARREVWANVGIVQLGEGDYDDNPTKYHGKGFGREFDQRVFDWYRDSGVHGITLHDHNGYVWAARGFDWANGMPDYKQDEMRELIDNLRAGRAKNKHGEVIPKALRDAPNLAAQLAAAEDLLERARTLKPGEPGYPTAYELSQLGRRTGQRGKSALWFGKVLRVHADQMILNPDEGEVISP